MVNKLLSARFLIAIGMTATGCIMALHGEIHTEFGVLWGVVLRDYFSRSDRKATDELQKVGDS